MVNKTIRMKKRLRKKSLKNKTIFALICFIIIITAVFIIFLFSKFVDNKIDDKSSYSTNEQENSTNDTSEIVSQQIYPIADCYKNPPETRWNLTLNNKDNPIDKDYENQITLVEIDDDQFVDIRIYEQLLQMLKDANSKGVKAKVTSSYRTWDYQKQLFDNQYNDYINSGYSQENAQKLTQNQISLPGYSEHQIGLAVDINSSDTSICSPWTVYSWLAKNSYKYGFILRYPENKIQITGVIYEPWHFRFVGIDDAKIIFEKNITLEEYLQTIKDDNNNITDEKDATDIKNTKDINVISD